MAVGIVLTKTQDARLVHWAARVAKARHETLILFWARRSRKQGSSRATSRDDGAVPKELGPTCAELASGEFRLLGAEEANDGASEKEGAPSGLEIISLESSSLHFDIEEEVGNLDLSCLFIPRERELRLGSSESTLHDHLIRWVTCEVVLITAGLKEDGACRSIVTPVAEGPHSASCLLIANDIARTAEAELVALHVEPEVDVMAQQAAHRILSRSLDRALGIDQQRVTKRVVLANTVIAGVQEALDADPNLIILGMKRYGMVRRFSSQGVADKLLKANLDATIAVVQSAMPVSSRVGHRLDALLKNTVPQLPRDGRISLVESIQRSSQWDFDFVMLICMSALIAAGGLIQNSAAVVIGAMLVAPLMTPLLGTGLSITQGNIILFRGTLLTVFRGFLLAFLISFFVGMFAAEDVTSQMAMRGTPRVLDILVAMVGGIAAAYASCRPNLLSALPGVAIAASLVPPIATSGIAAWLADYSLAAGAALLFFTNIVAIVLGTWLAFRAVGIRSAHEHGDFEHWTLAAAGGLLMLTIGLGVVESMPERVSGMPARLQAKIERLAEQDRWACRDVLVHEAEGKRVVSVVLDCRKPMTPQQLQHIRSVVEDSYGEPPSVRVVSTLVLDSE